MPEFKIGKTVKWVVSEYWSTRHPDDAGYEDRKYIGSVISFDTETVCVGLYDFSGFRTQYLNIKETRWI